MAKRKSLAALAIAATGAIVLLVASIDQERVAAASASAVDAGGAHTCAIAAANGTVHCWGYNAYGQLGSGTTTNSSVPVAVTGLGTGIVAISAGGFHTCAVTAAGGAKCWGRNDTGQLGDGSTTSSMTPVNVVGLSSGVAAISAGGFHTCALLTSGGAKCWGRNDAGQVGDGTGINRPTPADVSGLSGVAQISAGGGDAFGEHTCAVTVGGAVKCWGRNDFGQLGNGSAAGSSVPVDVAGLASGATEVHAGRYHTCTHTTASGVKCWGWNIGGQLGNGTFDSSSTPVDVISLNSTAASVSTGGMHACVRTSSSSAKCWGFNDAGQLGNGMAGGNHHTPGDVVSLSSVQSVTAGGGVSSGGHTCALLVNGTIRCWGENGAGQLGDGSTIQRNLPAVVTGFDRPDPTPTSTPTDTPGSTPSDTPEPTGTEAPASTSTSTPTPQPTWASLPTPTSPGAPTIWELIDDLHESVVDLGLPRGTELSLTKKLEDAEELIERGKYCTAMNSLEAFINKVRALRQSNRITVQQAADLIEQAQAVIEAIRPNCRR